MTSELLIMNKSCVVMAADSAATVQYEDVPKIFTADKIFALSKKQPIGVMTYGVPEISGVPVEVLVKEFRSGLDDGSFPTVDEYAERFFEFIKTRRIHEGDEERPTMIPADFIERENILFIGSLWGYICRRADKYVRISENGVSIDPLKYVLGEMLDECEIKFKDEKSKLVMKRISEALTEDVIDALNEDGEYNLRNHLKSFVEIAADKVLLMDLRHTGLVFAGYGDDRLFPSYVEYRVYGYLFGELRYKKKASSDVNADNPSEIMPFAQKEVVGGFLLGTNQDTKEYFLSTFEEALDDVTANMMKTFKIRANDEKLTKQRDKITRYNEKKIEELIERWDEHLSDFFYPAKGIIKFLSKDELASMAELLIDITSLKRRLSDEAETVGGPADVAVISRGDGFVWVKRKHYFSMDLNPYYQERNWK